MKTYFNCKVTFDRTDEHGLTKRVAENYLVDAVSFTDAEARICKECEPYITGEFKVESVRRYNTTYVFHSVDCDKWYRCKVNYISIDEERGIEKVITNFILINSNDFNSVVKMLNAYLVGTVSDFEIISISKTNILDVFEYETPSEEINEEEK